MPNHLANENSPYLLQHAENPVEWYPWGEEALERARRENKPIFLSIGYAACHWCHVMAHESFEDPDTAAVMNENFINIKVDREERPDLDSIYMNAVIAMTGQGGWPMSVFLTPEGEPFFGGTYFPPVHRYNMPSFREVLLSVNRAWQNEQSQIIESGKQIAQHLKTVAPTEVSVETLKVETLDKAAFALAQAYDWKFGGWGQAPKFPQAIAIEFLLRRASRGDKFALEIAVHSLQAMARGGMYDLIGGGFSRYSTDNEWLVPHFEKMLYDNAQLALVYLHAYLLTGEISFRRVCEETLDFIQREMSHSQGGFFSSLDADSEGQEGKYYLWTVSEIRQAFPNPEEAELVLTAFGVTEAGNLEGRNVLQRVSDDADLANHFQLPPESIAVTLRGLLDRLLEVRGKRVHPAADDKVLTAWNALALIAFSEAARYLKRQDYLEMAIRNADFLLRELIQGNRLLRSWREGKARHNAYLEDFAGLALGLISLYQSDPETRWFQAAVNLVEEMIIHFRDLKGGFFDTSDDQGPLLIRPKELQDNAIPSGSALAATVLLQLAAYTDRGDWRDLAESMLGSMQRSAGRYPTAFGQWLCAIDFALAPVNEVAVLGDEDDPRTHSLWAPLWETYKPDLVVARSSLPIPPGAPALLENRHLHNGQPTAYVCQHFVCQRPVNSPEELRQQLEAKR